MTKSYPSKCRNTYDSVMDAFDPSAGAKGSITIFSLLCIIAQGVNLSTGKMHKYSYTPAEDIAICRFTRKASCGKLTSE